MTFPVGTTGSLHSPNYPAAYADDADCVYVIRSNEGSQLEITFDGFKLESADYDGNCDYDWLQIFDGDQLYGPPITETICGEQEIFKLHFPFEPLSPEGTCSYM